MQRRGHRHRGSARDGAETYGNRCRVPKGDDHIVRVDLPQIRDDLREYRLHALTLRACARRHVDLARSFDAYGRAFERPDARALVVAADPEAKVSALVSRRALADAKSIDAAERFERFAQRA